MASRGGGCGFRGWGFGNGDKVRIEFRLAEPSDGRGCPRGEGDGLNSGVVGADSRRMFLAAMEGDAVTDDAGGLGEPAEECLGEDEAAAFTEEALASPDTRGLALFGTRCADVVVGEDRAGLGG